MSQAALLLGRRPRPWWGMAPLRLLVRAVIQGGISVLVVSGAAAVRGGRVDLADHGLEGSADTIHRTATVALVLGGVVLVYSAVRVVVAGIDLVTRTSIEGTVVSVDDRMRGDVLPGFVQDLIWSRGDRIDTRIGRPQLVLDIDDGTRTWQLSNRDATQVRVGQRVRLTSTPLLGHVRAIEPAGGHSGPADRENGATR